MKDISHKVNAMLTVPLEDMTAGVLTHLNRSAALRRPTRLIVRKGIEHLVLKREDIVLFYTDHKLTYALHREGKKFLVDANLTDLEDVLDRSVFFRANRQFIVNINFIRSYRAIDSVKIKVDMLHDLAPDMIVVISQETAPRFRRWMNGEPLFYYH